MNYRGSYRKLLENAKAAMIAAVETYNKPRFEYREEVFVILLINAWELILKAVVSKAGRSIYYRKERKKAYKTVSWKDGLLRAKETDLWPPSLPWQAVQANLHHLNIYRDNAVHFYNAAGFEVVIYGLARTAIVNFNELLKAVFGRDLGEDMNWTLLPIGVAPPVDPIAYLKGDRRGNKSTRTAVDEFLGSLSDQIAELKRQGIDTGHFITVYEVKLQSVKKLDHADIVVGVDGEAAGRGEPVFIERRVDPLKSHPLRQKNVLEEIRELHGQPFTQWDFQAVVHHYRLREKPEHHWHDPDANVRRWSRDIVAFIRSLTESDLSQARQTYRDHLRERRRMGRAEG